MLLEAFEQITRTLPDCILVIDAQGTIRLGNRAAFKIFKSDRETLYGKNLKKLTVGQEEKLQRYINNWLRSSEPLPGVLTLVDSDGCQFELHVRGNLLQPQTQELPALILLRRQDKQVFIGAFTSLNEKIKQLEAEIVERKRAHETLYLYEHIVNASTDLIVIVDRNYRYIAANQHFLDAFNKRREEVIGREMVEIAGKENFEKKLTPEIERAFKGETFDTQTWMSLQENDHVCLNIKYKPYEDRQGNILGAIITAYDITSLKEAQSQLEESEHNLREAQRIAHLGSWDLDLITSKLYWSEEIFHLFEIDPGESNMSYEAFLEVTHPDDREELDRVFQESVKNRTPYDYTHRLVMKDGKIKYVKEKGRTFYDKSGMPIRSVGTVLDVTELKLAEEKIKNLNEDLELRVRQRTLELHNANLNLERSIEELKNTQAQLVQSEKMASLGGMVAGVAHEVNTPIGMGVSTASYLHEKVTKYARLYEEGVLTQEVFEEFLKTAKESAEILLNNLTRAADLIRSFKQVAVDQTSDDKRVINLKVYLLGVLQSLKHEYAKAGHEVTLECPEHIQIHTYPGAFSQILTNLIMNSLTHGFEEIKRGCIAITVESHADNIKMVYKDNGKGLEENVLKNIFEPFYTTKRGRGGSGLGMHIVFNLVHQALNGRISCDSRIGEGVKFIIEIPTGVEHSEGLDKVAV